MQIRLAKIEDAEAIAKVHVDTWRSTYRGIVPDDFLASMSYEQRTIRWRNSIEKPEPRVCNLVAEVDGTIVGFTVAGPRREGRVEFDGELCAIYILQEYQGRGIGKALVHETAKWLRSANFQSMLVWVLKDNSSRRFYEKLGGIELDSKFIEIGGCSLENVSYGWPSLDKLSTYRAITNPSLNLT